MSNLLYIHVPDRYQFKEIMHFLKNEYTWDDKKSLNEEENYWDYYKSRTRLILNPDKTMSLSSYTPNNVEEITYHQFKKQLFSNSNGPFTQEEDKIMNHLVQAHNAFLDIDEMHPSDITEWTNAIHQLQKIMGMRVLRRNYPGYFNKMKNHQ